MKKRGKGGIDGKILRAASFILLLLKFVCKISFVFAIEYAKTFGR